jgi:hypothetical protein
VLSLTDAAPRAQLILQITAQRVMPPWPADPSYRHFLGEHVITDEQIALIATWVDQGAREGDRS